MPPLSVRFVKRTTDIVAALVGLGLTLPLWPAIALAIRLDSKGPIFFAQLRAKGLIPGSPEIPNQAPVCTQFLLYKFRTMTTDAERRTGAVFAVKNDPRATRVGRFLRKVRLDELPQLWNVLKGDMSLVGPRPERPEILADLALAIPYFEERMRDCKPGLTGLAQVSLGYSGAIPEGSPLEQFRDALQNPFKLTEADGALADDLRAKMLYDLAYTAALERFATFLPMDLSIILRTPLVLLRGSGH